MAFELTDRELELAIQAVGLQMEFVKKDGVFQEWTRGSSFLSKEKIVKELGIDQMEFLVELDKLKKKLNSLIK